LTARSNVSPLQPNASVFLPSFSDGAAKIYVKLSQFALISGFFSGGSPAGGFFLLGDSSESGGSFIGGLRRMGGLIGGFFGSFGGSSRGVFDGLEGLLFFATARLFNRLPDRRLKKSLP
jgi:hypothetical protein